eukprot:s2181_g1.t1
MLVENQRNHYPISRDKCPSARPWVGETQCSPGMIGAATARLRLVSEWRVAENAQLGQLVSLEFPLCCPLKEAEQRQN